MDLLSDYLAFCLDSGLVGLALLVLTACVVVIAALALLVGIQKAAQAFARGWREAGPNSDRDRTDAGSR